MFTTFEVLVILALATAATDREGTDNLPDDPEEDWWLVEGLLSETTEFDRTLGTERDRALRIVPGINGGSDRVFGADTDLV